MDEMWPLVEAQYGAVARWQAKEHGLSWRDLERFIVLGVFEVVTRRVLRVRGAPQSAEQAQMIALLDAGPGAAGSRRSAAWVWGLPGFAPMHDDTVLPRDRSRSHALGGRWPRLLPEHHLTVVRGILVTTLARTFFDLAAMPAYVGRLGRLIDTVDGRTPSLLPALHTMLPELSKQGRNGIVVIRELLAERPPNRVRRTGLERRFEFILTSAGIAVPRVQVDLGGHSWIGRVDYYDDDIAVIYEIDSITHHVSLSDTRNDELRDAEALAAGFKEVVRIPEEHVWYEPHLVRQAVLETRRRYRGVSGVSPTRPGALD